MSASKPYIVSEDTPEKLKKMIAGYPMTVDIYRNIFHGYEYARGVFFEGAEPLDSDDPLIVGIIEKLSGFGLLIRRGDALVCSYTDIILKENSLPNDLAIEYARNVLSQTKAAFRQMPSTPWRISHYVGTLSENDLAELTETIEAKLGTVRDMPEGEKRFLATFVWKQL